LLERMKTRERLTIFVIVGMRTDDFFEKPGGYRIGVRLLVGTVRENLTR